MQLNLNIYETMALVSIIFYLGKYIRKKVSIFSKYCIPPSVVGGLIFSLVTLFLYNTNLATINLDTSLQNLFMTLFFTSIGFTASFALLKQGGKKVITFLILAVLLVTLQNIIGVSLATLFGLSPLLGLATGSIPMVGGHGTAGSFGPILEELGVDRATTVSVASATFGLIMGSIIGGLVARKLIFKYHLKTEHINEKPTEAGGFNEENTNILSLKHMIDGACLLFIAMGLDQLFLI